MRSVLTQRRLGAVVTIDAAMARIRFEFAEMPDLKLTLPQLSRLCNLPEDVCKRAVDLLVEAGAIRQSNTSFVGRPLDLKPGTDQEPGSRDQGPPPERML